ncbi:hypothetical protein BSL78_25101 [Apostichopus japonicus]|uniref:Uncharacterized protein n=1 Tax=Stichopus japonicus TaxID=307972 RepID=A0A2G8JQV0_STIJA|nr:hypothetical protein BSL78_25101 [Apostichopus japonicus]
MTSPVTSSEVSQYFHTITTATATTINNNNSDNNNTIYGLMGLVGLLIVLVLILIILHLCGQKRVKAKKLKRFSTGSQHIYENPSFVNHVLGSFRRTRDSAKTSQVDDDFWSTGGKTFREEDEVASSSKSSFTSNAAGVRGKLNIEGTNNEIVIHLKSSEVETTENETKFVDPVNVDGVVDDQSHSQTLDGDNVIEHDTMNADEGNMYVDMQDTARRLMLAWPATNINESSYQGKENSDRYNNVATTSPPEYSRRESKDDTYGIHTATSSYNLPGDEIETGVNNAEEDLSALYGTIDKSKSRNRRDKIENDDDELLDKPVATQNIEVENSDLYAVINKRTRHKEIVNNSSALRHKVSNSKVVERPKYAPPVPPQTSSDKLSRLL